MTKTTELVFILDRSGSMGGLESDTIGGYNSLLKEQKESKANINVSTVLFDDRYELLHDRVAIDKVKPITKEEYYVRGCTALMDAVGKTVDRLDEVVDDDARVMMVITTDGLENASRNYNQREIKRMIESHKEKGWEFIFLGANIDAIETARYYGISEDRASNYQNDSKGVATNFKSLSKLVQSFECGCAVGADWKEEIEEYYEKTNG